MCLEFEKGYRSKMAKNLIPKSPLCNNCKYVVIRMLALVGEKPQFSFAFKFSNSIFISIFQKLEMNTPKIKFWLNSKIITFQRNKSQQKKGKYKEIHGYKKFDTIRLPKRSNDILPPQLFTHKKIFTSSTNSSTEQRPKLYVRSRELESKDWRWHEFRTGISLFRGGRNCEKLLRYPFARRPADDFSARRYA